MPFTQPLSTFVGERIDARVQGLMDVEGRKFLYDLFLERHMLLFRNQTLSGEEQMAFASIFGPVSERGDREKKTSGGYWMISNNRKDGILSDGELFFHADHCFYEDPLKAICLYAIEVPAEGGDTLFADAAEAVRRMPEPLREKVGDMTSLHLYDYAGDYNNRMSEDNTSSDAPRYEHPILWPHPETGKDVLLVNTISTARINGVTSEEGDALLKELTGYVDNPELIYRHQWQPGDLVIWDNRALQHARMNFDRSMKRTIRRVPIAEGAGA
jgi:taurine dioxygenase